MAFLKFSVTKLELFARINFCFFGAYLSSIDRKILVNSDSSAFLNRFLIIHYSILSEIPDYQSFVAPILNDFWFLFSIENFHNRNDHFMEI